MMNWDVFIAEEQAKLVESRQKMQLMLNDMGIPLDTLEELKNVDLNTVDPEVLQKLEMAGGFKVAQLTSEKPEKNASTYRQKSNVMAV